MFLHGTTILLVRAVLSPRTAPLLAAGRAKKLQEESKTLGEKSEAKLRPHERLALALAFIQIAIALAAITVLTRRRWLLWGSAASAGAGMIVALTAFV